VGGNHRDNVDLCLFNKSGDSISATRPLGCHMSGTAEQERGWLRGPFSGGAPRRPPDRRLCSSAAICQRPAPFMSLSRIASDQAE
jgi:hypothetical protein